MRITASIAVTLMLTSPASAFLEGIQVQTQAQYQLFETKQEGFAVQSNGGFTTTYNIALRRSLTPLAKLVSNLTINSLENNDSLGRQQNRTMNFNLATSESTYTLNGGIDDITYTSIVDNPLNGEPASSTGTNRNYYLNFNWTQPAWPTANIQYRKNVTTATLGGSYTTNQWVSGAFYEFEPFRVSFDQTSQQFEFRSAQAGSSSSSTVRRRAGIEFDQQIFHGLTLQGNVGRETTRSTYDFGRSDVLTGNNRTIRLNAIPTPSLLFSVERAVYDTKENGQTFLQSNDSTNTTYSMRSEVLPGLALTVNHQIGEQTGNVIGSVNRNTNANLAARLTSDANLSFGWAKSSYQSTTGVLAGTDQTNTFASLQMPLGLANDFTADVGTLHSSSTGAQGFNGRYAGFTLRNRTRSDMSFGLGYRWNILDSVGGVGGKQTTNTVDFDTSWFPTTRMGINARLSYSSNNGDAVGSSIADYITPTVDLRWDLSTNSNLTLRYSFNRNRVWDWNQAAILQQKTRGLSGRFSYRLADDSTIDATYDYLGSNSGGLQWQKALRVFFTKWL